MQSFPDLSGRRMNTSSSTPEIAYGVSEPLRELYIADECLWNAGEVFQ